MISVSDLRSKLFQYEVSEEKLIVSLYSKRRRGQGQLVSSTVADLHNSTTVSIDITDYFIRHMSRPTSSQPKFMMSLRVVGKGYLPARFLINKGCVTPFLIVNTNEFDADVIKDMQKPFSAPELGKVGGDGDRPWVGDNHRRTKRRAKNWPSPLLYRDVTELEKISYHCRRQDLWINFNEIGWDFVITPKDVNIGDCGGQCLDADNNIAHAVVKQLLQNLHPSRNAGILCCQGANYKEISALYFKSKHEIIIGSMPKIIVKECRCR